MHAASLSEIFCRRLMERVDLTCLWRPSTRLGMLRKQSLAYITRLRSSVEPTCHLVHRDSESIASLKWYGNSKESIKWLEVDKSGWCSSTLSVAYLCPRYQPCRGPDPAYCTQGPFVDQMAATVTEICASSCQHLICLARSVHRSSAQLQDSTTGKQGRNLYVCTSVANIVHPHNPAIFLNRC